jgi:hypothetical protein
MYDKKNLNFPQPVERFECPACEGVIPADLVFSEIKEGTNTRHVVATCLHCDKSFERSFASVNGAWAPLDQVRVIDEAKRLRGIRRRVDKIRGAQLALAS